MKLDLSRKKVATRQGYGDAMVELGKKKPVYVCCADLKDSTKVGDFAKKFPDKYIEVGVAEQNLVTLASGLAAMGKIPFVNSYAMFAPGRCWEQIRTTICYNDQPVKIIGAHSGISVGPDGATHQAIEDIAIMRVLPNMEVFVPCDYEQTKLMTKLIYSSGKPAYLRFARNNTMQMTLPGQRLVLGKAQKWLNGKDLTIISAGPIVYHAYQASLELKKLGYSVDLINLHTIKPIDKRAIINSAKKTGKVLTLEEHQIIGGLGSAVSEVLSESYPVKVFKMGVQDKFGQSGDPEELIEKYGLGWKNVLKNCLKLVK